MKRSWVSISIVAGVLLLLTLFLGIQYRWISEVGDAERDRMQKRIDGDIARLAEDFNREMQSAYYNFQTEADTWRASDATEFNERYNYWRSRTSYPDLVREFYFFGKSADSRPLRYDVESRRFSEVNWTPELEQLRASAAKEEDFRPLIDELNAMLLPIYDHPKRLDHVILKRSPAPGNPRNSLAMKLPEKFGCLVVLFDRNVVRDKILPDLNAKYFSSGEYVVEVLDRSRQAVFSSGTFTDVDDARASTFDLSPDSLMFFDRRAARPRGEGNDLVISQRVVESHTFTARTETPEGKGETFKVEMHGTSADSKPRTAMIASTGAADAWSIRARHAAGSIDQFVRNERNKSFLIGLGVYLLLVGGIAALVISATLSKRFAQRQIDFVSSVSHEFRTPLAVIYSAGENLADGVAKDEDQVSRYGELIKGEGKKLSRMVEQILEFAGANSGRQNFNFESSSVSAIVENAIAECRPLIDSGGFVIEHEVADDLPPVRADRAALSGAIQNLIANSVKYSDGSKWIKVSAANGNGSVKISVEDRGVGIRSGDLRMIFEPFFRSRDVVDAQISGNGLGLNLVKKIVEAHGGKISVSSERGVGSTFTIEIPQK